MGFEDSTSPKAIASVRVIIINKFTSAIRAIANKTAAVCAIALVIMMYKPRHCIQLSFYLWQALLKMFALQHTVAVLCCQ